MEEKFLNDILDASQLRVLTDDTKKDALRILANTPKTTHRRLTIIKQLDPMFAFEQVRTQIWHDPQRAQRFSGNKGK